MTRKEMRRFAARTKVGVMKTRGEIERMLSQHQCSHFLIGVDHETHRARVQFKAHNRIVRFEIELPTPPGLSQAKFEQDERQRWRALHLVIKAKLESVESQIATFEQEFLANIVLPNLQTVGDYILPAVAVMYETGKMPSDRMLGAGDEDPKR